MAYGDFKNLNRRKFAGKVLHNKACNIANDAKYDGYQRGLATMVYEFFEKKKFVVVLNMRIDKCMTSVSKNVYNKCSYKCL